MDYLWREYRYFLQLYTWFFDVKWNVKPLVLGSNSCSNILWPLNIFYFNCQIMRSTSSLVPKWCLLHVIISCWLKGSNLTAARSLGVTNCCAFLFQINFFEKYSARCFFISVLFYCSGEKINKKWTKLSLRRLPWDALFVLLNMTCIFFFKGLMAFMCIFKNVLIKKKKRERESLNISEGTLI